MKLAIDIGNSRIKWARVDQGDRADQGERAQPAAFARPRENAADVFEQTWGALAPTALRVCSVAGGETLDALHAWARRHGIPVDELRSRACCGAIVNAYDEPERLGADRWANLLGARAGLGAVDTLIVDAGTAVTVDALRADGRHLGGAILAGLDASRAGLRAAAPALPEPADDVLPSQHSAGALGAGTLLGLAGAIERVAATVGRDLAEPWYLLTGGDAARLAPLLAADWRVEPMLTLRGLLAVEAMECAG